ncbi:hypothetical protein G6F42_018044 [Rhizopus arrhizus]|nr:hypothetical protein G6F42_018044 [Rhizopus arrhizus]
MFDPLRYRKERWFDDDRAEQIAEAPINDDAAEGGPSEKQNGKKSKNVRGANKGQRGKKRIEDSLKLCKATSRGEECAFGENCRFTHDLDAYLKIKGEDLGDRCVQFDLFGKCSYGYKCRFLKAHVDKDNKLVVNEAKVAENPVYTINGISSDVQTKLVKNRYEFPRSEAYLLQVQKEIQEEQNMKDSNALKRKQTEEPSLAAPSDKKVKADESDSENEEFFDAANEFTHVQKESAVPAPVEKPY